MCLRLDLVAGGASEEAEEEDSVKSPPGRMPSEKITVLGSPFFDPSLRKTPTGAGGRDTGAASSDPKREK